ncbi:MAG: flagellar basal-body rod protein FlgF [Pseudomonadota bacterium]
MSDGLIAAIGRQQGLEREMQVLANNIANSSTVGYKSDRAIFSEFLVGRGAGTDSLSIGNLGAHAFNLGPGSLEFTGGDLDLAIEGEGYFEVQTELGNRITRAGNFRLNANGTIVDQNGNAVIGAGGNPITLPETVTAINVAADGTVSADGNIVDRIALVVPGGEISRDTSVYFQSDNATIPTADANIIQGALEGSNVSPVEEIARLIEVQRAYEASQALMQNEDDRLLQLVAIVRDR